MIRTCPWTSETNGAVAETKKTVDVTPMVLEKNDTEGVADETKAVVDETNGAVD